MYKYPLGTLVKTSHQLGMIVDYENHEYVVEWYRGGTYRYNYSEDLVEGFVKGVLRLKDRNYEKPDDW